ncbi:hypothetical protein DFH09DRAFT_1444629 [Mycena vulgaris]|nr:hypothetical protein DFH09DRAFT_1444629 [Mycena vulgaris]
MPPTFSKMWSPVTGAPEAPSSFAGRPDPAETAESSQTDAEMDPGPHPGTNIGSQEMPTKHMSLSEISQGRMGGREHPIEGPMPSPSQQSHAQKLAPRNTKDQTDAVSTRRGEEGNSRSRREGTSRVAAQTRPLEKTSERMVELQRQEAEISRLTEINRQQLEHLGQYQIREMNAARLEVAPAPTFGITADLTSTSDVRRMMENLENEVFQTAAALSDLDFRGKMAKSHGAGRQAESHARIARVLGDELVSLLLADRGSHPAPEILVQIALQAAMSAWSHRKISSWVLDEPELAKLLTDLYADIRGAEDPKDGARWRTRGCLALDNKDSLKRKDLDADFGDRITAIVRLVLDLNRAIDTQIVSEDLEAVFIEPEAKFEPKTMDETWPGNDGASINDWVVCTTGFALRKNGHSGARRGTILVMKPKGIDAYLLVL